MPYELEEPVIKEVERVFSAEKVSEMCTKLKETALPLENSAPPPRVHIAVIWLSKGDIEKFNYEIEGAACDWRDTLVSAGLGGEDWRDILFKKGIECSDW